MLAVRLAKLRSLLEQKSLDAALISSTANIIYLTDCDYFSSSEREAYLLLTKNSLYLFTDARYSHAIKKYIKHVTLREISHINPFEKLLQQILKKEGIKHVGIEETNLVVHEHKKIMNLAQTKHVSLSPLRRIKTVKEIDQIKQACLLGDRAFSFILKKIKLGMTEKGIAFLLDTFIRKHGAEPSFATIVAFEENATVPHHKTGNKKLEKHHLILMDFGVLLDNYCSDMTRTICFGKATEEKKKIYQIVLEAQQKAIQQFPLLSGEGQGEVANAADIDKVARDHILSKDYPSIPHSLGHGIGLQVHEAPTLSPKSKDFLTDSMVFSIEPGIYLPDKLGVRIEDLFAIQNGKLIQLTKAPKELIEI